VIVNQLTEHYSRLVKPTAVPVAYDFINCLNLKLLPSRALTHSAESFSKISTF